MQERYRIRVKRADIEVEVESTSKEYVEAKLNQYLNARFTREPAGAQPAFAESVVESTNRRLSIREFVKQVDPIKKNEVAVTVAYFLEHHADQILAAWKPDQIADKFTDARKPKPANMTDLLVKSDFFMEARERGFYQLTELGVDWVETRLARNA